MFTAAGLPYDQSFIRQGTHRVWVADLLASYLRDVVLPQVAPDAVVITGDLATTGKSADLNEAYSFISKSPIRYWFDENRAPCIGFLPNIHLLPGNHDRYQGSRATPNGREFDRVFSNYWAPGSSCGTVCSKLINSPEDGCLLLVSADLSLRCEKDGLPPPFVGHFGTGRAYVDSVNSMIELTKQMRVNHEVSAVVWSVHFPPGFEGIRSTLALHDESRLIDAAEASEVDLILSGHTHEGRFYRAGGNGVLVNCAPSATESNIDSNWGFSVCAIDVDGDNSAKVSRVNFSFDKSTFDFIEGSLDVGN